MKAVDPPHTILHRYFLHEFYVFSSSAAVHRAMRCCKRVCARQQLALCACVSRILLLLFYSSFVFICIVFGSATYNQIRRSDFCYLVALIGLQRIFVLRKRKNLFFVKATISKCSLRSIHFSRFEINTVFREKKMKYLIAVLVVVLAAAASAGMTLNRIEPT